MNRKEDSSEQKEEEFDQIAGDRSPSSTSAGDEGAMSDEDEEIIEQANTTNEENDHVQTGPEATETTEKKKN